MNHYHRNLGAYCGTNYCPPSIAPTQYDPGMSDPVQNSVKPNIIPHVIKHVHPSHTTNVNKHVITHQHYFPHTQSFVNECCEQHVFCGVPVNPCCPPLPRPFGF
jgi:spore coat protein D